VRHHLLPPIVRARRSLLSLPVTGALSTRHPELPMWGHGDSADSTGAEDA
jgi:hypothetical protein